MKQLMIIMMLFFTMSLQAQVTVDGVVSKPTVTNNKITKQKKHRKPLRSHTTMTLRKWWNMKFGTCF